MLSNNSDPARHDVWIPTLKNLGVGQDQDKKFPEQKQKWNVGSASEARNGYPFSPLSYDSKNNVRVIFGVQKTEAAIQELVSLSLSKWKKPDTYRKFFVVWMTGHGVSNSLISTWFAGSSDSKKDNLTTLSSSDVLLSGIASGLKRHEKKLTGFHIIVFFDWCSALAANANNQFADLWESDKSFDCLDDFENVSILGWTGAATVTEEFSQMQWLGANHDLIGDDALKALCTGCVAPLRRLSIFQGQLIQHSLFAKNTVTQVPVHNKNTNLK